MPERPSKQKTRSRRRSRAAASGDGPGVAGADAADPATTVTAKADHHRRTRRAHASEIAEDYVEMIADLIDGAGEARVVDLARGLGVSHVTVVRTVSRLQ